MIDINTNGQPNNKKSLMDSIMGKKSNDYTKLSGENNTPGNDFNGKIGDSFSKAKSFLGMGAGSKF